MELTERRSGKVVCKLVNSKKAKSGAEIEIGGGCMASSSSSSKESCSRRESDRVNRDQCMIPQLTIFILDLTILVEDHQHEFITCVDLVVFIR